MKLYLFFIMTLLLQSQLSFGLGPDFSVQSPRIIVIGAGIAGLTAAYRLHQKGYAVEVYEARSRVGGRILSAYVNGVIAELGGENLADGGEAINVSALAKELGVPLEYTSRLFGHAFHHNGISSSMEDAIREYHFDPALLKEQLSALEKTSASMQEVLDQLFTSNEALKKYLSTRLAAYEGAPADQLSSAYIETLYQMLQGGLCAAHQSKEILRIHICGGNSKLTQALADKLQDRVHLNMPVVAVAKNEQDQYEIRFKDGSKAKADILLFAIPCPVYNDILFEANVMSLDRLAAIKSMRNGMNAKIIMPISPESSLETIFIDHYFGLYSFTKNILTAYCTGITSFFGVDTISQIYAQVKPLIAAGFKEKSLFQQEPIVAEDQVFASYVGPVGHSWPCDPFAQGSYTFIGVGQKELFTELQKDGDLFFKTLFAPVDNRIYFAGEHATSLIDVPGTIEAACQSGNMAAKMITKHLDDQSSF